ncbi:kinase-like domain-containing protein [Xylaria digitata]|nr:kinase-like domain-containing protein [Xylaria digitata]
MVSPEVEDRYLTQGELPTYARVEDLERYVADGFHPIHLGDRLGPDGRFEFRHKLGYSNKSTVWLCLDRKNAKHVGVKVLQAEKSTESHPEVTVLRLFEGVDRQELQSNHVFTIDEHFWIDGPNGRHLCLVVQGIDLDIPDLLTDLCLQAAQSLKHLHDKKICHGDFRPDHMRLQLDLDTMKGDFQEEDNGRRPRYLIEPADVNGLEFKYRTGQIAVDNFSTTHREADAIEPRIYNTHYTAPEIRFLKKSSGFSSDIWSLATGLDSRSSLVSWLAWAYGPFPQRFWNAVGEYLSHDAAIPVFTVNTILQKPLSTRRTKWDAAEGNTDPEDWGTNRSRVVAERKLLREEKARDRYLRIKLPKNMSLTGFNSLLEEDLNKERQWYQYTDALNGKGEYILPKLPGSIDGVTLQRLNGTWIPGPGPEIAMEAAPESRGINAHEPDKDTDESTNSNGKRPLSEEGGKTRPKSKKARTLIAEHNLRDLVERVEVDDMTKFAYRLQSEEAHSLASLLRDMLKNDPNERISVDEALRHEWFDKK